MAPNGVSGEEEDLDMPVIQEGFDDRSKNAITGMICTYAEQLAARDLRSPA